VVFVFTGDYDHPVSHDGRKMDHLVCNKKLGPVLRLKVSMLACVVIISGPTIVFAEPLFFDCHRTFEHTYPDEKLENHQGPIDWTTQIMIDAERGAVEWPGGGTNDYCARESDWMQGAAMPFMKKVIKDCTTLQISQTTYEFNTTTVFRVKVSDQPSIPEQEAHIWASGKLNRITGEFSADERMRGSNSDSFDYTVWKMTCVPAQRKF
jgi:hypothetical protein